MNNPSVARLFRDTRVLAAVALVAAAVVVFRDVDALQAAVLGLAGGALISAVAIGLLLTYRGDGVLNLANGATAMYAGYLYLGLTRDGRLFLPPLPNPLIIIDGVARLFGGSVDVPDVPTFIDIGDSVPPVVALVVVLVLAGLFGLGLHLVIFRHIRALPPLAKVAATVGLMIVMQSTVLIRFGPNTAQVETLLPSSNVDLGPVLMPVDQVILVLIIVAAGVGLAAMYRFTRIGIASRAAAENEKGAMLIGIEPATLAAINWVMSTVLTAALGMLAASVNRSVDVTTLTLVIVPALAVVLLANFSSFSVVVLGGLGLGVVATLIRYYSFTSWWPTVDGTALPGLTEAIPSLIIIGVLVRRGRRLPTRGTEVVGRLPEAPEPRVAGLWLLLPFFGLLTLCFVLTPTWRGALTNTLIGALLGLSLVVLTGFAGQISLAHVTLSGISAFALAHLADKLDLPFPVAPILAALLTAAFGVLVALPAARVRGVNLAIVTLAISVAVSSAVFGNPAVTGGLTPVPVNSPEIANTPFGPSDVGRIEFLGLPLDNTLPNPWFGAFVLVIVSLAFVAVRNLRSSLPGRQLLAVRADEKAATALGINVSSVKIAAFGLSAFMAGIAGALSAYRFEGVPVEQFVPLASIVLLAYVYLGGISSVGGAIAASTLVAGGIGTAISREVFELSGDYPQYLGGLFLIWVAVRNPDGMAGDIKHRLGQLSELLRRRRQRAVLATQEVA